MKEQAKEKQKALEVNVAEANAVEANEPNK
jgi:hypothetical protein